MVAEPDVIRKADVVKEGRIEHHSVWQKDFHIYFYWGKRGILTG